MKNGLLLILAVLCVLQSGCQAVRADKKYLEKDIKKHPPELSENVIILRSSKPTWPYEEMGKITENFSVSNIGVIFKILQKKAGAFGADAIINLDITSSVTYTSYTRTVHSANGSSYSVPATMASVNYQVTGILVHKIEGNK